MLAASAESVSSTAVGERSASRAFFPAYYTPNSYRSEERSRTREYMQVKPPPRRGTGKSATLASRYRAARVGVRAEETKTNVAWHQSHIVAMRCLCRASAVGRHTN